jgi:histidyl-tRNA synthetase
MRAFRRVVDAFRHSATRWGYEEIRTPTIETYSLFTSAGALTPQMLSRVYSFLDWDGWSGERVVLRPDSTIPVARAAAAAGLSFPARLFYVQNVFRFSETEDREDWQCGLEFLGAPETLGEIEVAAVGCETLEALGLKPAVRLGHAGIAGAVAAAVAHGSNGAARGLVDRVTEYGLVALREAAASNPQVSTFVDIALRESPDPALLSNLAALAGPALPGAVLALEEVGRVARALVESGRSIVIDLGRPLDFEYYTGVVFEFEASGTSWGSGGRYSPGGSDTPEAACGLGLDLGHLTAHVRPTTRRRITVAIIPVTPDDIARAMAVARALHRSGIPAALGGNVDAAELSVRVGDGKLVARTPQGETELAALDDVVGLLVQFK